MQDIVGEVMKHSEATFYYGPLHIDTLVLADQKKNLTKIWSVLTWDTVKSTSQEWWPIDR